MAMNLADMKLEIERMIEMVEDHGLDPSEVEVRLAHQPRWAFEYSIDEVQLVDMNGMTQRERSEMDEELEAMTTEERAEYYRTDGQPDPDRETKFTVYIAEGSQIGYLPGIAAEALEWTR